MVTRMRWHTTLSILTIFVSHISFAQDVHLNDFMDSVEGTKIKTKPGRHVCTTQKTISRPIPVLQKYRKPVYTPKPRECPNVSTCPQFDVSYELANRTVYTLQKSSTFETNCCPGWTKQDLHKKGCMKPICKNGCGDFGVCVKPDACKCRPGYTGPLCDTDIDECATHDHGCLHQCKNTAGSYMCACQEGFNLAPDGRTCIFCFTCQKEYQDLLTAIAVLSERSPTQAPAHVDESFSAFQKQSTAEIDVQSLNSTISELMEEVKRLSGENIKLKEQINELETQYETTATDIETLQNLTRTTTPSPTTTSTTKKTTTTTRQTTTMTSPSTTTTTPSTTTTRTTTPEPTAPTTEAGLQFDSYDLIVSLSNQIGLMEEKLELCQCTRRSGRGFG